MKTRLILFFFALIPFVINAQMVYPDTDLGVLMSIRDSAPLDSPLKTLWADTANADNWFGVTWDTDRHGQVIHLLVSGKKLAMLDVTGLAILQTLNCSNNELISLKVSGLSNLNELSCFNNKLTDLDLNGLTGLKNLNCFANKFSRLDVSNLINLEYLGCENNNLTDLNINGCSNLWGLTCYLNRLDSLDVSNLPKLNILFCQTNNIKKINTDGSNNIIDLRCQENRLTFSSLEPLLSLHAFVSYKYTFQNFVFDQFYIDIGEEIDFSSESLINGVLTVFNWYKESELISTNTSGKFTPNSKGIYHCRMENSNFPNLELITNDIIVGDVITEESDDLNILCSIRDNAPIVSPLKTEWADTTQANFWTGVKWDTDCNGHVVGLDVTGKIIDSLDLTKLNKLYALECMNGRLQSLNIEGLKFLREVNCSYNTILSKLNIKGVSNLCELNCETTSIAEIDLQELPKLENLICSRTNINSLNAKDLNKLVGVSSRSCQLTNLSLTGCSEIKYIHCGSNRLDTLNVSYLPKLEVLSCTDNKLAHLDITGSNEIKDLDCKMNRLPFSELEPILSLNLGYHFDYNPQDTIFSEQSITIGDEIDFSFESLIEGIETIFQWYKSGELIETNNSGKFIPSEVGIYNCKMENLNFPDLELITNDIVVNYLTKFEIHKNFRSVCLNCFPNPFKEKIQIAVEITNPGKVTLEIINQSGQVISKIMDGLNLEKGFYKYTWDKTNQTGYIIPAGVYYIRLNIDGHVTHKKVVSL